MILTRLATRVRSPWASSSSGVGGKGLFGALLELEPEPAVAPGLEAVPSGTDERPVL